MGDAVRSAIWLVGLAVVVALAAGVGMVVAGLLAPDDAVIRFAVGVAVATTLASAGAWATARLASQQAIAWSRPATAWLLAGLGVASVTAGGLASRTIARFAHFDPDYVGVTLVLPAAIMAVVIGSVVHSTTVGGIRRVATILVILGTMAVAAIVVLNLVGLRDGLRAESWGLAAAGATALLYCAAAAVALLPSRVLGRD
jgi:hypothetical protein